LLLLLNGIFAAILLGSSVIAAVVAAVVSLVIRRGEKAGKMLELAINVLASDPPGQPALRKWATKILAYYSPVELDEEAQRELRDKFMFADARGEARIGLEVKGRSGS
jgi:hypothetical protein